MNKAGNSSNNESDNGHIFAIASNQSSILLEPSPFSTILDPIKSIETIFLAVTNVLRDEKYSLLYHHIEPPNVLPCTLVRGTKRKFNVTCLERYPWLLYNPKLDGVFCGPYKIQGISKPY